MIFRKEPLDFKKEIDVVGCYVQHDGKFVLLHRHAHKTNGNTFGLPAGKMDKDENIHQAMSREVREETGLEIPENDLEYFDSLFVRNEGHDIVYHMFSVSLADKPEIKINDLEHKAFVWVSPSESLQMKLIHDLADCTKLFYRL